MTLSAPVSRWKLQVDAIMKRDFLIDLAEAGASDDDVVRYFGFGFSPRAFSDWFGEKYDLDRVTDRWTLLGRAGGDAAP
jgi:hypothetical protein